MDLPGGIGESGASSLARRFNERNWQYFCMKDSERSCPSFRLSDSYWRVGRLVNWRVGKSGIARSCTLFSQWNSPLSGEKKQLVTLCVSGEARGSLHPPKATSRNWPWQKCGTRGNWRQLNWYSPERLVFLGNMPDCFSHVFNESSLIKEHLVMQNTCRVYFQNQQSKLTKSRTLCLSHFNKKKVHSEIRTLHGIMYRVKQ